MSIVIRENGGFEVYSDFMLVNEYMNPTLQCVDVETDFDRFYLKFVKNVDLVNENTKLENLDIEIRQVRHFWRNRISFSTTTVKRNTDKWHWVTHKRVSRFFRLYTQILNFNMYMLVSHRNMISVYDMTTSEHQAKIVDARSNGGWIKTIQFEKDSKVDGEHIRQMFIKKRPKS